MQVILGIGNIGKAYEGTRHNVGFAVVEALAARAGGLTWQRKWSSDVAEWRRGSERVLLVKPRTLVNLSGEAVQGVLAFHKLTPDALLVVVDDINLPVGSLRARPEGSAGGHNGLRDIEARIGKTYPRLRLGVGAPPAGGDQIAHVLGGFRPDEREDSDEMIQKAATASEAWLEGGMAALLGFNGPLRPPPPREKPPRPQKPIDPPPSTSPPPIPSEPT
jgi:peptidyl-tRNA hydrolase, PTH1 family